MAVRVRMHFVFYYRRRMPMLIGWAMMIVGAILFGMAVDMVVVAMIMLMGVPSWVAVRLYDKYGCCSQCVFNPTPKIL